MTAERLFTAQPVGRWRTFACPHCETSVVAVASAAGHHCGSHRNRWVEFVVVQPRTDLLIGGSEGSSEAAN